PTPDLTGRVFTDETGPTTNMARPRGRRLVSAIPHGHWKTTTCVADLRHDDIQAPCVLAGPMDGETFRADAK
ncbi:MAG: IS630 family transposase, partial [Stellaceae bacterium]